MYTHTHIHTHTHSRTHTCSYMQLSGAVMVECRKCVLDGSVFFLCIINDRNVGSCGYEMISACKDYTPRNTHMHEDEPNYSRYTIRP